MRPGLEKWLFDLIVEYKKSPSYGSGCAARRAIETLVSRGLASEKQAYATLDKWTDKDYWDYGVSIHCGWFTQDWKSWEEMTGRTITEGLEKRHE